ncbi:MAG: MerR family transcriptional regulator [Acidobacteriota bacterium]|nr:MerR family transcriptional regulator [Acidobacteriota bacterium]
MTNHKMYYRMGEVAEMVDLEAHVIRFWEDNIPQLAPKKSRAGHRIFTRDDIDLVMKIKRLVHEEGFTIAGVRRKLAGGDVGEKAEPAMLQHRVAHEIREVKGILENVLNMLDPS